MSTKASTVVSSGFGYTGSQGNIYESEGTDETVVVGKRRIQNEKTFCELPLVPPNNKHITAQMDEAASRPKPVRDSRHYLGSVTILVDNCLFKVPKRCFTKNSRIFGHILALSQGDPCADESRDDSPVYLDNIRKKDFERLLEMMFPVHCRPVSLGFEKLDPVDKIWLGKVYNVPDWLIAGYQELVSKEASISEDEGERLGVNTVIRVCQIREQGIKCKGTRQKQAQIQTGIQFAVSREIADARALTLASTGRPSRMGGCSCPTASWSPGLTRNEQFYMENIIFLVEGTLFKVPRASFERSALFATIFSLSASENTVVDGSDDEHPFKLDGISKSDFQAFLEVLYPCDISTQLGVISETVWISALKLSTMWDHFDVRNLAIKMLSTMGMDPVTQVVNAIQYNVHEWLPAGLERLAKRREAISISEAKLLGWEMAIRIYQVREKSSAQYDQDNGYGSDRNHYAYCAEGIRKEFAEELKGIEQTVESERKE